MNKWKKYIPFFGWLSFFILLIVVMSFVSKDRENVVMSIPDINVETHDEMVFLTQQDVLERLKNMQLIWEEQIYQDMDIDAIEYALKNMPEISNASVFFKLNGNWEINCKLRVPIARVVDSVGASFYIDSEMKMMPLSRKYSARVIPVTGYFSKKNFKEEFFLIHNESLINKNFLEDVYRITNYVCKDEVLSALITQIEINKKGDFELITLLGDQRVIFGKAVNIEEKFEKLKIFYKNGISKTGWDLYREINIKFKDQIVCTKK